MNILFHRCHIPVAFFILMGICVIQINLTEIFHIIIHKRDTWRKRMKYEDVRRGQLQFLKQKSLLVISKIHIQTFLMWLMMCSNKVVSHFLP